MKVGVEARLIRRLVSGKRDKQHNAVAEGGAKPFRQILRHNGRTKSTQENTSSKRQHASYQKPASPSDS